MGCRRSLSGFAAAERGCGGARGTPGTCRGGNLSKSVAKALRAGIGGEKKRGISTFFFRRFGVIGAFATDLDKRCRRGPLRGRRSRRSPRRSGRPTPPRAPKRAFCTQTGTSNCTSRRAQDRPARTDPDGPGPRRPAPAPARPAPPQPRPTDHGSRRERLYTTPGARAYKIAVASSLSRRPVRARRGS